MASMIFMTTILFDLKMQMPGREEEYAEFATLTRPTEQAGINYAREKRSLVHIHK